MDDYPGTMLIISHDRYLINQMADRILYIENESMTEYLGNYDYYLLKRAQIAIDQGDSPSDSVPTNDYAKRKSQQSAINKLTGKIQRMEDEILSDEGEIHQLETQMADPDIASDYEKANALAKEVENIKSVLEHKYEALHALETELSELN